MNMPLAPRAPIRLQPIRMISALMGDRRMHPRASIRCSACSRIYRAKDGLSRKTWTCCSTNGDEGVAFLAHRPRVATVLAQLRSTRKCECSSATPSRSRYGRQPKQISSQSASCFRSRFQTLQKWLKHDSSHLPPVSPRVPVSRAVR